MECIFRGPFDDFTEQTEKYKLTIWFTQVATICCGRGFPSSVTGIPPEWHAIGLCREKGCYKLMLSSNLKRARAHAFYDSLGFERHGHSFRTELA